MQNLRPIFLHTREIASHVRTKVIDTTTWESAYTADQTSGSRFVKEHFKFVKEHFKIESDLLVMIYGAIMGVVGSIVTSITTALFQVWLDRREHEKRVTEERERQLNQIYLPTDAEAGSVIFSMTLSSTAVYQVRDPRLGFAFGACLGFLITRRVTKAIFK